MLEVLVEQRFYVTAVLLFSVGLAALLLHPNLIKKIIGLNLMDTAVFLFLAAMGYVDGGKAPMVEPGAEAAAYINPVPGGLVLTGGFSCNGSWSGHRCGKRNLAHQA